ncbi:hypothetical protein MX551_000764 [Salmonella enterica]|uniref:Uncharacterized protein n=1 Tax=Salmonella diarizonae TaxID=59204 RepID=A0A726ZPJ2_SALDZ|nr:hypothetical protein [Salmonella enterica]EBP3743369.1 hypothetical protein [Salmonella enterica subsp. arizonae]EDR1379044.1 hypothetical protein [Salmonella enterica subsp. diarizonae serovar 61:r:z53]EIG1168062.1 hypothetical protein [Salmonella enterica subsp. diarizonae serovar 48:k:z53]HAE6205263.1 hypothetical protein [Salmonella enterica subsp. diarizonae serovar 50:l,v:z35]HCA3616034.1 hypothetical protein [Salmonella enterica subsp. diarizonae serovar 61:i:z]HCT3089256.1 hypothet
MTKNRFVNIIGNVTESNEKLRRDPYGTHFFQLQEILTEAINGKNNFPEIYRESLVHALLSGIRVIERVSMNYRHKNP